MKLLRIAVLLILIGAVGFFVLGKPATQKTNPAPTPEKCSAIKIVSPEKNSKITSPLLVKVIINNTEECRWTVFEAQAGTVKIKDASGKELGQGVLKTTEEWTTDKPVNYEGEITFSKPASATGIIEITEENPSGRPNPQKISLNIDF